MKAEISIYLRWLRPAVGRPVSASDYNYNPVPATKKHLENFPLKQIIFNWNSLSLELKATSEPVEFESMLKRYYLSKYNLETECSNNCFICNSY